MYNLKVLKDGIFFLRQYVKVTVGFPGDPVFKTPCFIAMDLDSVPGWGSKIWHALQCSQKLK